MPDTSPDSARTEPAPGPPYSPAHRRPFTFADAYSASADIIAALSATGLHTDIEYLAGGCAGVRVVLPDRSAVLISSLDATLPQVGQLRTGWMALHYAYLGHGIGAYSGDENPATVYESDTQTRADDTADMLTAVLAYLRQHTAEPGSAGTDPQLHDQRPGPELGGGR
jgi:hypothetical protein